MNSRQSPCLVQSGVVALDYFAYDRSTDRVWVPASNTGNVDVIDGSSDAVSQVTGFKTGEVELRGRKVPLGPTAVSVGEGVVYIGNRGDSCLCVIDAQTLKRAECLQVAPPSAGPAAVPYAAASVTATLSIIDVADDGKFHLKALVPTVKGARGVVAGKGETAYLIDPAEGRILKLTHK